VKNVKHVFSFASMSRPKSAAVKIIDINIADILEEKISVNIDMGKGDIDPTL